MTENDELLTRDDVRFRYGITTARVTNWIREADPTKSLIGKRGRPATLDDQAIKDIKTTVKGRRKPTGSIRTVNPVPIPELNNLAIEKRTETEIRRGKLLTTPKDQPIAEKVNEKIRKAANIAVRKSQDLTLARLKALADLRLGLWYRGIFWAFTSCKKMECWLYHLRNTSQWSGIPCLHYSRST